MRKLLLITAIAAMTLSMATVAFAADGKVWQPKTKMPDREVRATADPVKAALDCSGALTLELDQVYTGTTVGAPSNVSAYSCSFYDESGPEVVYVATFTEPTMFHIDLIPEAGVDLDLAVLDSCDEDLGCLIVVDTGVLTNSPVMGTFYFVVEGYAGAAGSYTLETYQDPIPEPVSACDRVEQPLPGNEGDIIPSGVYSFSGDTCAGENSIEFLGCAEYTEAGNDNWYELTLLPGAMIEVAVTNAADGALWILDACAEPFGCLAYADATLTGETEFISYTNSSGSQMTVFLVVDTYGAGNCGAFTGEITIHAPGVIPIEGASWGEVKARF